MLGQNLELFVKFFKGEHASTNYLSFKIIWHEQLRCTLVLHYICFVKAQRLFFLPPAVYLQLPSELLGSNVFFIYSKVLNSPVRFPKPNVSGTWLNGSRISKLK